MSSIPLMLEYVSGLGSRPGDREAARAILAHEDYRFELRRYEIPSAEHLTDYFSRLDTIPPEDIPDPTGRTICGKSTANGWTASGTRGNTRTGMSG